MGNRIMEEAFRMATGRASTSIDMGASDVSTMEFAESYATAQQAMAGSQAMLFESLVV